MVVSTDHTLVEAEGETGAVKGNGQIVSHGLIQLGNAMLRGRATPPAVGSVALS